jgi:hypothetical protein
MFSTIIWPAAAVVTSLVLFPVASPQLWKERAALKVPRDFVNPKVSAGKVCWHTSFESAREAAGKSGKLILLFQMMGKLDDQFC